MASSLKAASQIISANFNILPNDTHPSGDSLDPSTIRLSDFTGQFRDQHETNNSVPAGLVFDIVDPAHPADPGYALGWLYLLDADGNYPDDPSFDVSTLQPEVHLEFSSGDQTPIFNTTFKIHYRVNSLSGKSPANIATLSFATPAYFTGSPPPPV